MTNTVGLKRGSVILQEHNPIWRSLYFKEERFLKELFGDNLIQIEHIGSTSVSSVVAKPIIDIAVLLKSMHVSNLKKRLTSKGYEYRENASEDEEIFFAKGPETNRTHYVHVYESPSTEFDKTILFRNALLDDSKLAKQYSLLKKKLAKMYPNDRTSYTKGKGDFINKALEND